MKDGAMYKVWKKRFDLAQSLYERFYGLVLFLAISLHLI